LAGVGVYGLVTLAVAPSPVGSLACLPSDLRTWVLVGP
jgi:hypothetical protein